jgi:hypothetical protein
MERKVQLGMLSRLGGQSLISFTVHSAVELLMMVVERGQAANHVAQ